MNFFQDKRLWLFLAITPISLFTPGFALTQPQSVDSLNPQIPVPKISYSSTFEGYTAYQEPKPLSWQGANAQVMQSNGHTHGGMENTHPSSALKESFMSEHHGSHHH